MRRLLPVVLLVTALVPVGTAAATGPSYEMVVTLDPETHRLEGQQWIRWTNTSDTPTSELWWHLYLNAFANDRTTFMSELGNGFLRLGGSRSQMEWGWVEISTIGLADGTDLSDVFEFQRPDDGNPDDFSVARVVLPEPVLPGVTVEIETSFTAQLPKIIARTGFAGDFHLVGQWFPKLGVFEGTNGWNCHQFHANSEFYADFGSYRVTINVPAGWVVGATGMEITRMEVPNDPSRGLQVVFSADRVHDFAWTTAPETLMAVVESDFEPGRDVPQAWLERAVDTLGMSAADLELPPAKIRLLLPHSQLELADRLINAARLGIAWYGLWYGPYPYPQLTVIQPPPSAEEAGGMEYPTFITAGGSRLLTVTPFRWIAWPEVVTIHEFGHQYFQGILASNEFEQAWLDEGLNSYAELACMESVVADGLAPDLRWGGFWARERLSYAALGSRVAIDQNAWSFRTRRHYFTASYGKTALALRTLEGLIGPEVFARGMRQYFDRFGFQHPTGDDFFTVMNEVAGQDLGWFFDQGFRADAMVDWSVLKVRQRRVGSGEGFHRSDRGWEETGSPEVEESEGYGDWSITVEIGRKGDFVGPVEIELEFEDLSRERRSWNGEDRWMRLRLKSAHRLSRVIIDPDGVWVLETSREDNYWADQESTRAACRSLWWISEIFKVLGLMHMPWS